MQMTPQATRTSSVDAAERGLGEVLWRDTESGFEGRTLIRTPKCTIGSHPDSTICLPEPAALHHATLTFGKRFTLLKAPYPTQIAGRFVREWLIDEPTELNIGSWRIVVVPARCSKSLATVVRPESFFDGRPDMGTPAAAVGAAVRQQIPAPPSIDAELANKTIERLGQIEEQSETRIKAVEASLESLRQTLELVQADVARNSNELVTQCQAEFQSLSRQWASEVQQQLQSQLELRDTAWTQSLQTNLSQLENQMSSLGRQIESLSTGFTEKLETRLSSLDQRIEEDSPRWRESLQQVETRLADISDRVERLTSTTDDNAQRMNAIASITQENYDYVLGQIQAFQPPAETVSNGSFPPEQEASELPPQDRPSWSYNPAAIAYPSDEQEPRWDEPSSAEPTNLEGMAFSDVAPPAFSERDQLEQSDPFDQAAAASLEGYRPNDSFSPSTSYPADSYPADSYPADSYQADSYQADSYQADSYQAESYPSLDEPSQPSFSTLETSSEEVSSREEYDPELDVDDLSERLKRLIADTSQSKPSQAKEDAPLFPNSVLAHYEIPQPTDGPEEGTGPEYSEFGLSSKLMEEPTESGVLGMSGFSPTRLPWHDAEPQEDSSSEASQASLDADAILAKYGSAGSSEFLDEGSAYSEDAIVNRPSSMSSKLPAEGNEESAEDESIEAYMQKLLQRVKSGPDTVPELPKETGKTSQRSRMEILTGTARETTPGMEAGPASTTRRMMSQAEFTPRDIAPEKKDDLDALRELANMNARQAISQSDIKRTNSAILFKVSLVSLAIASAAIIYAINGIQRNPPFVGMIAALIVACLWGYDCVQHFRQRSRNPRGQESSQSADTTSIPIAKD